MPNSHRSALQGAPTPPLGYKKSPNWVWEKMDQVASLPFSWSASFPIKIIIPCSNTFSPYLLACCAVSRMSLSSVTYPALLVCALVSPALFWWLQLHDIVWSQSIRCLQPVLTSEDALTASTRIWRGFALFLWKIPLKVRQRMHSQWTLFCKEWTF